MDGVKDVVEIESGSIFDTIGWVNRYIFYLYVHFYKS